MFKNTKFNNYKIFIDDLSKIDIFKNNKTIINTINPHSFNVAKSDLVFQKALKESGILLPDGIGIVWAVRFLRSQKIKRIAGADIHEHLLKELKKINGKVFYMGAAQSTLQKIKERIKLGYPNITVETYSPPYKPEFTKEENKEILEAVNNFEPDVLFVGMTAPKQEKWVYKHKEYLNSKVICSIGAVFDFYAGTVERAPYWMINVGLEWLYRLIKEPQRMWKRYIIGNFKFVISIFKAKI